MNVQGHASPGFEAVAEAFAAGFAERPQMGAALAIRHRGELVVSLWGGVADARDGRAWTRDTPSLVFSCTKGLMALLAAQQVAAGKLAYDSFVTEIWPEFGASGKGCARVSDLLAHRAGVSAPRSDWRFEDLLDWDLIAGRLAAQVPLWPAGQGYAYHAITHGWLIGEILRRVTGQTIAQLFAERVTGPLRADAWIGRPIGTLPPTAHVQAAPVLTEFWAEEAAKPSNEQSWIFRAMTLGGALPPALVAPQGGFNDLRLQAAEVPGAGGIATAEALATIWSATVVETEGVRLVAPETLAEATRTVSEGPPVFEVPGPYARWGMGFQLDAEARRYLTEASFGHDGAGGQVGFADPRHEIGFAYITNWMEAGEDRRATEILDALRPILGAQR